MHPQGHGVWYMKHKGGDLSIKNAFKNKHKKKT